jgi:hypothetical protein
MTIVCDANKLPEEIKNKAHEYTEKRKPRFRTFGVTRDDVENAWLNGFAFCMEGTVKVKAENLEDEIRIWGKKTKFFQSTFWNFKTTKGN